MSWRSLLAQLVHETPGSIEPRLTRREQSISERMPRACGAAWHVVTCMWLQLRCKVPRCISKWPTNTRRAPQWSATLLYPDTSCDSCCTLVTFANCVLGCVLTVWVCEMPACLLRVCVLACAALTLARQSVCVAVPVSRHVSVCGPVVCGATSGVPSITVAFSLANPSD